MCPANTARTLPFAASALCTLSQSSPYCRSHRGWCRNTKQCRACFAACSVCCSHANCAGLMRWQSGLPKFFSPVSGLPSSE